MQIDDVFGRVDLGDGNAVEVHVFANQRSVRILANQLTVEVVDEVDVV